MTRAEGSVGIEAGEESRVAVPGATSAAGDSRQGDVGLEAGEETRVAVPGATPAARDAR